MIQQNHPFHIVHPRPWPLLTGTRTFGILLGTTFWILNKNITLIVIRRICIILCCSQWWRDISRERSFLGYHTNLVISGLRWGIILFITSEVLFFFSFFWTFFHRSLAPNFDVGAIWPPLGIQAINPYQVPLLNTIVLLSSGLSVTYSHHATIKKQNKLISFSIFLTLSLGFYFTLLQAWEYLEASYRLSDSIFGSSFFLATGFHGIHVVVGTLFLMFSFLRHLINLFSKEHHIGLEAAIWYWHFVDVIWLFLYSFIYWWSF
jgi:cytochrome c oxidase subunit 3